MQQQTHDRPCLSRPAQAVGIMAMAAAVAIGMMAPAPVAAQLLNGNFEHNPKTPGFTTVSASSFIDPTGNTTPELNNTWQVTLGSIDIGTGPAGTACQFAGTHCIDLNGNEPGRIEQSIKGLAAGQQCSVNFFMSRHVNLAASSATMRAFINNAPTTPATFVHNTPGVSPTDGKWQAKSFVFTAAGGPTLLAFATDMKSNAGPQIDNVTMECGPPPPPPNTLDPCCPPWNATALANQMVYYQAAGGGIGSPYTLHFQPSSTQNAQLTAYMNYLHAVNSALTTISIDFKLFDAGTGAVPVTAGALSGTYTETWTTSSGPAPVPTFFNAGVMVVNHWYTIRTHIHLNGGNTFFPKKCDDAEMSVRIQVQTMKTNQPQAEVLQIRLADGTIIERPVTR